MRLWLSTAISYECEIIHLIIRTKVCVLWIVYYGFGLEVPSKTASISHDRV
jgi:hypothetical protein